MNLLILKGFNNYFNRKIKKYSEVDDYSARAVGSTVIDNFNFTPGNGVSTSIVLGLGEVGNDKFFDFEKSENADYLVCYTSEFIHNEDEDDVEIKTIESRWFIIESDRTRGGQYQITLKRDVIADNLEQVLSNPCFVEKGYVKNNDPLIFNSEAVNFNEIKQYPEYMLKDGTGCPWIVIYMAQNFPDAAMDGMEGTAPNKFLSVVGKTTIDTSTAIRYTDLPWIGLDGGIEPLSPNTAIPSTYIRRIPGEGKITLSPIIAGYMNSPGVGRFIDGPTRLRISYNHKNSNAWNIEKGYTRIVSTGDIGGGFTGNILLRKDIGLTPNNTSVRWGESNDGNAVCAFSTEHAWMDSYNVFISGTVFNVLTKSASEKALSLANATDNRIINYINNKSNFYETTDDNSPVPGTSNMYAFVGGPQSFLPASEIQAFNGKLVTNDGINYYKIRVTKQNRYTRPIDAFEIINGKIGMSSPNNLCSYLWSNINSFIAGDHNYTFNKNTFNNSIETFFEHSWFDIQYIPVATENIKCRIMQPESSDRIHANDVAYDMICLPYGQIDFKIRQADDNIVYDRRTSPQASLAIARAIAAAAGDAVYDMQLLPYCPYRQAADEYEQNGYIDISGAPNQKLFSGCWFKASTVVNPSTDAPENKNAVTFGLWCYTTHGTFNITKLDSGSDDEVSIDELLGMSDDMTSEDIKEYSACKKYRLVSPNFTSIFEFNPLKNGGVSFFNVDYNYRPYNPYIHVNPNFEYLYGQDTNDQRGLILQGDFSVGYISSAWTQYQIQNANYNEIFNRDIKNMDTNWRYDLAESAITAGFDAVSNSFNTASAGSGSSNPIIRAGIGMRSLDSGIKGQLIGAAADAWLMGRRYREAKSYKKDQWALQLGNVKAQPYGLAKSDTMTENFKYFPFIEVYDCTDKEKEVFRNKLKYDGMTVEAIGTIQDYLPEGNNYEFQRIKGKMMMLENLSNDFEVVHDIYEEVNAGFYYVPYVELPEENEGE